MYDEIPSGQPWSLSGSTGTIAAALAANSIVFAIKAAAADATRPNLPPPGPIEIERIQIAYTSIVASAGVLLAGRALQLFRGTDDAAGKTALTGGAALTARPKRIKDQAANSGLADARIATTGTLTVGAFTRDTVPLATMDLVSGGSAGFRQTFEAGRLINGESLWLDPGEILVVSNPAIFDLLLTWQLTVNVDYRRSG